MSISGVLEELSNTPIPSLANIILSPSEEIKDLISSAALTCPPSPSQSIHSETHSNQDRAKSEAMVDKVLRASGEQSNMANEDGTDSRFEKKSTSSAMKNIISHFMSATASGQVVQVSCRHSSVQMFIFLPIKGQD